MFRTMFGVQHEGDGFGRRLHVCDCHKCQPATRDVVFENSLRKRIEHYHKHVVVGIWEYFHQPIVL